MSIVDNIIGAESGGNPNAHNPRSSAGGLGQFINSTWLSMIAKHRPDIAAGKSPGEILALKSDPRLSREMTSAYAADNAGILSKSGLPVTPGSTYLAHFAGPQGAVGILSANPSTPVASILTPAAVQANPFLRGMTAADLRTWADRKVGGTAPIVTAPQTAAAAPPLPPGIMSSPAGSSGAPEGGAASTAASLAGLLGSMPSAPQSQPMKLAAMPHGQSPFPDLGKYLSEYMNTLRA